MRILPVTMPSGGGARWVLRSLAGAHRLTWWRQREEQEDEEDDDDDDDDDEELPVAQVCRDGGRGLLQPGGTKPMTTYCLVLGFVP